MDGFVAQLNRASDYGSEGSGFESQRSHSKREVHFGTSLFCFLCFSSIWLLCFVNEMITNYPPINDKVCEISILSIRQEDCRKRIKHLFFSVSGYSSVNGNLSNSRYKQTLCLINLYFNIKSYPLLIQHLSAISNINPFVRTECSPTH